MGVLEGQGKKTVKIRGHRHSQGHEGSHEISAIGNRSVGKGHGCAKWHGVVMPNFGAYFPKCKILSRARQVAQDSSSKFLV